MRTAQVLPFVLSGVVAAATLAALPLSASPRRPPVRIEKGVVINSRAGYYFSLAPGWVLDNASDDENVKVLHPDSGATFDVRYERARGNATMYYTSLTWTLGSPDQHWLSFGKGMVTLGGREAMGVRGTREKDGTKVKELLWVALVDDYVYFLSSSVALDRFDARAPEIDLMFSSFKWGKPAESP
jgi:hypothetical protein